MQKKGISLIVLVITIIVMIILAATIIISINNANVMKKANEAVESSDIATIKSAADLEYAEYLMEKPNLAGKTLGDYLTDKLVEKGTIQGKEKDYYIVMYDNETVVVKVGSAADKYYKGEIEIGDHIDYFSKCDEYYEEYQQEGWMYWQVLGINKNNELLITFNSIWDFAEIFDFITITKDDYANIENKLHNECKKYADGKGAVGARSITMDDINRVTGYVYIPDGSISDNGNTITYYWDGTNKPYYECSNGQKGNLNNFYSNFSWFDENGEYHTSVKSTTSTKTNMEKICTITVNDKGVYDGVKMPGCSLRSKKYILLYGVVDEMLSSGANYFIATKGTYVNVYGLSQGVYYKNNVVNLSSISPCYLNERDYRGVVRPVVMLDKNIVVEENSTDGWTIK